MTANAPHHLSQSLTGLGACLLAHADAGYSLQIESPSLLYCLLKGVCVIRNDDP